MNNIMASLLSVLLYIFITVVFIFFTNKISWGEFDSENIILFSTGVILVIYTVQTYYLRKESQNQTETQLRPYLQIKQNDRIHVSKEINVNEKDLLSLEMVNIGLGIAKNIQIKVQTNYEDFKISIKSIDCLGGGGRSIQLRPNLRFSKNNEDIFNSNFNNDSIIEKLVETDDLIEFLITYQDVKENHYKATVIYNRNYTDQTYIRKQEKI